MQFLVQPQAADFKDAERWFPWRDFANGERLGNLEVGGSGKTSCIDCCDERTQLIERYAIEHGLPPGTIDYR
jgi:hypothetical protein